MDEATRTRLLGLFVNEAEENLATLAALSERFRDAAETEAVDEFCNTAHSFKGASAAVGLPDVVWVVHRMEAVAFRLKETSGKAREELYVRLCRVLELLESAIATFAAGRTEPGPEMAVLKDLLADVEPEVVLARQVEAQVAASERAAPSSSSSEEIEERLSVPAHEVDEALRLASSISRLTATKDDDAGLERRSALELAVLSQRLEGVLFNLRMLPASHAVDGLDEEVKVLAQRLGKEARLTVLDHHVRADRRTLQTARTMIRHLIRNALDHGLEPPAKRVAKGKPAYGTLKVTLGLADASLWVTLEEDGAGFDVAAIRAMLAARSQRPAEIAALSDSDVLAELVAAGGSTRSQATEVSGRGVGLAAVASMTRKLGGDLKLRSQKGKGSAVTFSLSLEVYATEVLTVVCGDRRFGIPTFAVETTVLLGSQKAPVSRGPSGAILPFEERIIHLRPLGKLVGVESAKAPRFAVLVRADDREVALSVDELGEATRIVPHALGPFANAETLVTGVALAPDGRQIHVVNPRLLVAMARQGAHADAPEAKRAPASNGAAEHAEPARPPKAAERKISVLLAEDSLATREVIRVLLEHEGFEVRVAGDGEEAQARLRERLPDVLVSDFNMPRCDGPALARAVRLMPTAARLPVIFLTSRDDSQSRAEGAAAGADAYLLKSQFNGQLLRQTLRKLGVVE